MTAVNGKIVVSCNMAQKDEMLIGGIKFKCANIYEVNYREKSPVVCRVESGDKFLRAGDTLLVHHNTLYTPSPYFLYGNLFSIPVGKTLFAKIHSDGSLEPIFGNILCDRVDIETTVLLPVEDRKKYLDRVIVTAPGWTSYKPGDLLFTRPYSFYEICYIWNGIKTRIHKCHEDMVVGIEKKYRVSGK